MCTVSYIPLQSSVFLSSNRDEKKFRSIAIHPEEYEHSSGKMIYPKDPDAGGTWIAAHETGNAIVFLNGARHKHESLPPYRLSRGIVLLDMLNHHSPVYRFNEIELTSIEPFTAVIYEQQRLFQARWDGKEKELLSLDPLQRHIWSSCTLYTDDVIEKRQRWFKEWNSFHEHPSEQDITGFHLFTGDGDEWNDLRMNRDGVTFTVSVTTMEISAEKVFMQYHDLRNGRVSGRILRCSQNMVLRS